MDKKEMASETGWFFINLKRDIEKGIKDGIRVDRLYSFSKRYTTTCLVE